MWLLGGGKLLESFYTDTDQAHRTPYWGGRDLRPEVTVVSETPGFAIMYRCFANSIMQWLRKLHASSLVPPVIHDLLGIIELRILRFHPSECI